MYDAIWIAKGLVLMNNLREFHTTSLMILYFLQANLQFLMDGLRSFISEQNRTNLEAALTRLKEDLMLDASKINQLSTALWIFQVEIMMILFTFYGLRSTT